MYTIDVRQVSQSFGIWYKYSIIPKDCLPFISKPEMSQDLPAPTKLKFVVIDDHELLLDGTLSMLRRQYPEAEILTAQTAPLGTAYRIVFSE